MSDHWWRIKVLSVELLLSDGCCSQFGLNALFKDNAWPAFRDYEDGTLVEFISSCIIEINKVDD